MLLIGAGVAQLRQQFPIEAWQRDIGRRPYVEMPMQGALLSSVMRICICPWQVLELLVFGAVFPFLPFRCALSFFEALEPKELVANQGLRSARDACSADARMK